MTAYHLADVKEIGRCYHCHNIDDCTPEEILVVVYYGVKDEFSPAVVTVPLATKRNVVLCDKCMTLLRDIKAKIGSDLRAARFNVNNLRGEQLL
jgi:hypothetical protein